MAVVLVILALVLVVAAFGYMWFRNRKLRKSPCSRYVQPAYLSVVLTSYKEQYTAIYPLVNAGSPITADPGYQALSAAVVAAQKNDLVTLSAALATAAESIQSLEDSLLQLSPPQQIDSAVMNSAKQGVTAIVSTLLDLSADTFF